LFFLTKFLKHKNAQRMNNCYMDLGK